jgi:hypothetical protein
VETRLLSALGKRGTSHWKNLREVCLSDHQRLRLAVDQVLVSRITGHLGTGPHLSGLR